MARRRAVSGRGGGAGEGGLRLLLLVSGCYVNLRESLEARSPRPPSARNTLQNPEAFKALRTKPKAP